MYTFKLSPDHALRIRSALREQVSDLKDRVVSEVLAGNFMRAQGLAEILKEVQEALTEIRQQLAAASEGRLNG